MIIYLDIIILTNLIFNLMILSLTKQLARINVSTRRLILGTIIATGTVIVTIYSPSPVTNHVLFKVLYSILIILSTFGYLGLFKSIRVLLIFYFVTFSIGGGLFAIHYILSGSIMSMENITPLIPNQVNYLIVIIGFPLIWLFTKLRMDRHVKDKIKYDQLYEVVIKIGDIQKKTTGFIDSGNQLVDPFTQKPVILCEATYLENFFSNNDWQNLKAVIEHKSTDLPERFKKLISLIPYHGASDEDGFLYALKPDLLVVNYDGNLLTTSKVLIGIKLGDLTIDQSYQCLLHPEIIYQAYESA